LAPAPRFAERGLARRISDLFFMRPEATIFIVAVALIAYI
jgi:hypothetical protein